jgi:hypothetical protein
MSDRVDRTLDLGRLDLVGVDRVGPDLVRLQVLGLDHLGRRLHDGRRLPGLLHDDGLSGLDHHRRQDRRRGRLDHHGARRSRLRGEAVVDVIGARRAGHGNDGEQGDQRRP